MQSYLLFILVLFMTGFISLAEGVVGYNSLIKPPNNIQFADVDGDGIDGMRTNSIAIFLIYPQNIFSSRVAKLL